MLISEQSIEEAIREFLSLAKIPRPRGWSTPKDGLFVRNRIVPAYLASLEKIEKVERCYGFDETKIIEGAQNDNQNS